MTGKWKKIRSIFAIALSTAIVFTAVPGGSFVSNAAQVYEITAGDEEPVVEVPMVSDGDAPIVEEPTLSGGDAPVVEEPTVSGGDLVTDEPTVSDGDSTLDPELYQSKKLKVKALNTTVFTGQKEVKVAQIMYEETTSSKGLGFAFTGIKCEGLVYNGGLTFDTDNPDVFIVSVAKDTYPAKYEVTLTPNVPGGIYAEPAKVTVNVVPSIDKIELTCRGNLYKAPGKALNQKIQATTKSNRNVKPYKANALSWSVAIYDRNTDTYIPYEGEEIKIKDGKLSLAANYDVGDGIELEIKATAADYDTNSVYNTCYVKIHSDVISGGKAIIAKDGYYAPYRNKDVICYEDILGEYFRILKPESICQVGEKLTEEDCYDSSLFTYKTSSKDVTIDADGKINFVKVSGKPVTLTAIGPDGKSKASITLTPKAKNLDIESLSLSCSSVPYNLSESISGGAVTDSQVTTAHFNAKPNRMMMIRIQDKSGYLNDAYSYTYSIKGAKNVTSMFQKMEKEYLEATNSKKYTYDYNCVAIIPTAKVVEITIKAQGKSRKIKLINDGYIENKLVPLKGEPKLTTSATFYYINDKQDLKVYVGKQCAGGKATLYVEDTTVYASYSNLMSYTHVGGRYATDYEIDEDGYITIFEQRVQDMTAYHEREMKSRGTKFLRDYKYYMKVTDSEGKEYKPYLFTLKFAKSEPKLTGKLRSSYKVSVNKEMIKLPCMSWSDTRGYEDREDGYTREYYYYQPLTLTGLGSMTLIDCKAELGQNLLQAGELPRNLDIGYDDAGNYYLAVRDYKAYSLLEDANAKIISEGKAVEKNGKDAKLEGYLYFTYQVTSKEGYVFTKKDKVKVSIVIPKSDWTRLKSN